MDETLIHKVDHEDISQEADKYVNIPSEDSSQVYRIGFNIRPFAVECLKEANKYFEVIVFTAGTRNYANCILDVLDPTGELIQHRLFRDSCIEIVNDEKTLYIKDLRILEGRKLEDIIIVDNAVISFAHQIDNGIPILPFREDKDDNEFLHLIQIMKDISQEPDCRNFIKRAFKISEIMSTDTDSYAHLYEFSDSDDESSEENLLDVLLQCHRTLSLSSKKSSSEIKKKVKKTKKRGRLSMKKSVKKVRSVLIDKDGAMEDLLPRSFTQSNKCISPKLTVNPFEINPVFKNDAYSEEIPLE